VSPGSFLLSFVAGFAGMRGFARYFYLISFMVTANFAGMHTGTRVSKKKGNVKR
jgi:hypothetical protein